MKKRVLIVLAIGLLVPAFALADGLPSSKATADVNTLVRCTMDSAGEVAGLTPPVPTTCVDLFTGAAVPVEGGVWVEIMAKSMKLSNSQSLFVSPSLVSGLYTRTRTKTQDGSTSTAQAMGAVYLRAALIPAAGGAPIVAAPLNLCNDTIFGCKEQSGFWGVVLDSRIQTLTQDITACTVLVAGVPGTCDFTSTIDFILQTASAHTFNFIFPNVGQGTYTLKVYAAVGAKAEILAGTGTAVGAAAFGLGSVTAESVRLVHDFEF